MTPLHQAVLDGNMAAARLLIRHGADVNKLDEDTWTPLHAACAEGHTEIVRYPLTAVCIHVDKVVIYLRFVDLCIKRLY